jgi:hypothetical protein
LSLTNHVHFDKRELRFNPILDDAPSGADRLIVEAFVLMFDASDTLLVEDRPDRSPVVGQLEAYANSSPPASINLFPTPALPLPAREGNASLFNHCAAFRSVAEVTVATAATRMRSAWSKSPMPIETAPFDSALYLKTEADIAFYLQAVLEANDAALRRHALAQIARASAAIRHARQGAG